MENVFKKSVHYGFEGIDKRHIDMGKEGILDGQEVYISYAKIGGTYYAVKIKLDVMTYDKHLVYKAY